MSDPELKKRIRFLMLVMSIVGGIGFALSFIKVVPMIDLLQMYCLSGFTVGITILLATSDYYSMNEKIQARIQANYHALTKKASRDQRAEDRKIKRAEKKMSKA